LLLAAVLAGGLYATTYYSIGVFTAPWEAEFGWRKSDIAVALSIHPLCLALAAPIVGGVIDRVGVRRPAFTSLLCMALGFVGLSLIGPARWTLYVAVALFAFAGAATTPVLFTRCVIESFNHGRGLAMGITVGASTFTALLAPIAAYFLINHFGWRSAWLAFAGLPLLAIPFVFVGLREVAHESRISSRVRNVASAQQIPGVSLGSAMRGRTFWLLCLSFFMLTFAVTAALAQIMPILKEMGLPRGTAVGVASAIAFGLAAGRILGGYLIDHSFAPRVFAGICLVAALGLILLATGQPGSSFVACFCVGFAGGTEIDLLAYLVSRYFGRRHYGKIYGWQWTFSLGGSVISPVLAARLFELQGSYASVLAASAMLAVVAAALSMSFGPYPDAEAGPPAATVVQ
jgi:MFS family permease